jgi:hypothetical protein
MFQQVELECNKQSAYLKIQDGETKTIQFDPNKFQIVDNEFDGKVTRRVEYKVTDHDSDQGEKTLSMALLNARQINEFLKKGRTLLEIHRIGSGRRTRYNISTVS